MTFISLSRATAAAGISLLVAACGAPAGGRQVGKFRGVGVGQLPPGIAGRPAPRIRLADARGGSLDTPTLKGTPYAVTFLYTNCPDVCPILGEEIRQALERLGPQARHVEIVAVSVDPRNDTPEAVRAWLKRHREPPNFHYLIGSGAQLKPVWTAYYAAPQIPGDPSSSHTASLWLIDRRGRWRAQFSAGARFNPADLAYDLRVLLR